MPATTSLVVRALGSLRPTAPSRAASSTGRQKSEAIFYTRTTGLWQPVWIEAAGARSCRRPAHHARRGSAAVTVSRPRRARPATGLRLRASARFDGRRGGRGRSALSAGPRRGRPDVCPSQQLWSPERPNLYDLTLELVVGRRRSSTAWRATSASARSRRPRRPRLPEQRALLPAPGARPGLLAREHCSRRPSDEAIQYDIKLTKALGFNGARKHQKVEDPRWLYWADRMGLLVWGEMANAYDFTRRVRGAVRARVARGGRARLQPSVDRGLGADQRELGRAADPAPSARQQAHLKSALPPDPLARPHAAR